jgi:hypothetical protein
VRSIPTLGRAIGVILGAALGLTVIMGAASASESTVTEPDPGEIAVEIGEPLVWEREYPGAEIIVSVPTGSEPWVDGSS